MINLLENIVPKPVLARETGQESLCINRFSVIVCDPLFYEQGDYLSDLIYEQTDIRLRVQDKEIKEAKQLIIKLKYAPEQVNRPEMYVLKSVGTCIECLAGDIFGIVHAIHTFLQLLPLTKTKSVRLKPFEIQDYPRFSYRGMHLDVSRHFYPVAFIKKYIEYLAHHKFNYFHWHLTDDQGWRIEIKAYPKLTTVGAWRNATLIGHFFDEPPLYHRRKYGGFYTKEEIKEVIEYAAVRGITIIPEIDIPGHSRAAIAAYPELGTHPETQFEVATTWGMYNRQNNVLAPRKETFEFIERVFDEVCRLFPANYIHIGGDECSKLWWKESEQAQLFIKEHNLKDEKDIQTYIVNKTANYIQKKNKKVIAWHDVLEGEADKAVVVMNWGTEKDAVTAVQKGYNVISTPGKPLYFDHYQKEDKNEPLAIHGYNPLKSVYEFEPLPEEIKGTPLENHILGAQGNVWTEYMGTPSKVQYMVFPRMTALSEVLWSLAEKRNFDDFKKRLKNNTLKRYKLWGVAHGSLNE